MCLTYSESETNKLRAASKDYFIFYKVLKPSYSGIYYTPLQKKPVDVKKGFVFKYNRRSVKVSYNEIGWGIDKGIHVLTTRKDAREWKQGYEKIWGYVKIFKVKCLKKDLVGTNFSKDSAVFTKIQFVDGKPIR